MCYERSQVNRNDCYSRVNPAAPLSPQACTGSSTFWNSFRFESPVLSSTRRSAPNSFTAPEGSEEGPVNSVDRSTWGSATGATAERGSDGCAAAGVQYNPCPGDSVAAASGAP